MTQLIKVYTPIKRVPTMIGKAQNGQKLPFGPYTLPQVAGGIVVVLVTSVLAMILPVNPAVVFVAGLILTIVAVFGLGLLPYSGVRVISRALWFARLVFVRAPVSASGFPVTSESARHTMFIEETVVVIFPDGPVERVPDKPTPHPESIVELLASQGTTSAGGGERVPAGGTH